MINIFKGCVKTALVLFILIPVYCQKNISGITGTITDALSSEPVEAATILILENNKSAITSPEGTFRINNPGKGKLNLKISHIAYNDTMIVVNLQNKAGVSLNIRLLPKDIKLDRIYVESEKYDSKFKEYNDKVNVLNGNELEQNLKYTLAETIKNQAGISIRSMGPAPARPVFRGLGGNRLLLCEDGVKTVDLSATSPDHAVTIDPFSVEKVEIIRGPEILIESPVTIGGVVNVTKNEIPEQQIEEIKGESTVSVESVNSGYGGSLKLSVPLNSFTIRGEINRKLTKNLHTPDGVVQNSDSDDFNYNAGGSYFFGNNYIGFSGSRFELDYGIPGGFVGAHPKGVDISMFRRQFNIKSHIESVSEVLKSIDFDANSVLYRHKEFEAKGIIGSEFKVETLLSSLNLTLNKNLFFTNGKAGLSVEHKDFNIGGYVFSPPSKSINIAGSIFEQIKKDKITYSTAVRYEYGKIKPAYEKPDASIGHIRERVFNIFSLSFSADYEINNSWLTGINLSKSSRMPTIEELYSEGPHLAAYSYEVGNPDLKDEKGLGVEIYSTFKKSDFYFYTNVFYYYISDYILPRNTGRINYQTFLPVYATSGEKAVLTGIENQAEYHFSADFSCRFSLSYTYGEFRNTHKALPQIPPAKGLVSLNYNTFASINLTGEYALSQNRTDIFEERTAGYFIMNLSVHKSFGFAGTVNNITLGIQNVLNTSYRNHLSRIKSILPEAGRNFSLLYKIYF